MQLVGGLQPRGRAFVFRATRFAINLLALMAQRLGLRPARSPLVGRRLATAPAQAMVLLDTRTGAILP